MRCSPLPSFCSRLFILLISVFVVSLPAQNLNFAAPVRYSPGGNGPNVVAMADLNGDGKLDIVVGNWCANNTVPCPGSSVGVLLGNGDGTFKPGVAYASGGVYLPFVAIGDLNGDGKPDIVAANCGNALNNHCIGAGGNLGVLFGNGDGTFQPAVTIPLGGGGYGAIAVSIADVNGDGKPDLIAAGDCANGGCGGVLLGNGDGTFQPEMPFITGGLIVFAMVVGDVNGDGFADVVIGAADETAAHMQALFDTNVFGVVRMLHAFLPLLQRSAAPVVVNLSSGLSKTADLANPDGPVHFYPGVAYPASKTAVNTITVQYAKAFPAVRINAVDPGYTATDLNGRTGTQTVEEGAGIIVRMAQIGPDGPTGGHFTAAGPVAW